MYIQLCSFDAQNMFPQQAINLQKNATNVNKFQNNFLKKKNEEKRKKTKWVDFSSAFKKFCAL